MFRQLQLFVLVSTFACLASANSHHQQIHLSFGQNIDEMIVTWVTKHNDQAVHVRYGLNDTDKFQYKAKVSTSKYVNPGKEKRVMFIHRAILQELEPGRIYKYRPVSAQALGPVYTFRSRQLDDPNAVTKFAMFADMGLESAILPRLTAEVQNNEYDMVFHVGDIAYDLHSDQGRVGDKFMHEIEPLAARIAYQTAPGNHERKHNFSQYVNRFTMIDQDSGNMNNHYYSFNMNNIHFIIYSTEFYFYTQFGTEQIQAQYNWLREDLRKANLPENRAQRPFIITMAHRNFYCNGYDLKDCIGYERIFRQEAQHSLEDLFNDYGVDLNLSGHEHWYVKMLPVYNNRVNHHSTSKNAKYFTNPPSMLNVVSGGASNMLNTISDEEIETDKPEWVAKWSLEPSYSRITVFNSSTLHFQQIASDEEERVIDEFTLKKTLFGSH